MSILFNSSVTGDCQNLNVGALSLTPTSGVSPYIIDWQIPNLGIDAPVTTSLRQNLSAGTYLVLITDSTTPGSPNTQYVSLSISSGVCLNTESIDTSCGLNNGQLGVTATTTSSNANYYLYSLSNGYITSASSVIGYYYFTNLSADTYYVNVFDQGGCSGTTSSCIVQGSDELDFGFFVVNNSFCAGSPTGRIYVTGQTGTPPYSYLWSNLQTTPSISGLTPGVYDVTITDSQGCVKTKSTVVGSVNPLSIINYITTSPGCFQSDGQIIVNISGGTGPYYYSLSNGAYDITYSQSVAFSNLGQGSYTVVVVDAGLCSVTGTTSLSTIDAFSVVNLTPSGSTCNSNDGSVNITLLGGLTPYTYQLTDSSGNTQSVTTNSISRTFTNLSTGVYTIKITNPSACIYQNTFTITNTNKFNISTSVSDASCGLSNGSVTINVDTPGIYSYYLNGLTFLNTSNTTHSFNALTAGIYNLEVKDSTGCSQKNVIQVKTTQSVDFTLLSTGCGSGSEGTITSLITSGVPPYTFQWSSNVNGQTGIYVTGLTAGTYSLKLTDSNNCSTTKNTNVVCQKKYFSYQTYEVCDGIFTQTAATKNGMFEMLNQGYLDLISGETNCKLNSAVFYLEVDVAGTAYTKNLFTTTSLLSYPSDQDYINGLKSVLEGITGIGSVIIDVTNNTIKVSSDCSYLLSNKNIKVSLEIDYDICCVEPTPTPTNTPTNTQTPTNTPTNTETPTNTPTQTNTPTSTETPTNTPTQTSTSNTPTPTPTPNETPTQTPTSQTPTPTPTETSTQTPTPTQTPTQTTTQTSTPTQTQTQTQTPTTSITPSQTNIAGCGGACCTPTISSVQTTISGQYQLTFSVGACSNSCVTNAIVYYKKSYQSTYSSTFVSISSYGPLTVDVTSAVNSTPKDYFPIDFKIKAICPSSTSAESPVFQFEPCITYQALGFGTQSITGKLCSSITSASHIVPAGQCICIRGFAAYSPGTFSSISSEYCRTGYCAGGCSPCTS